MNKEKSQNPGDLPDLPGEIPQASTDMSMFRTRMSEHRTNLSEHRTELSEHRTSLSDLRSHLSNERTHLSQIRTAVSLMSFGVTLNRFSVYLQENNRVPQPDSAVGELRNIETVGAGMVVLGVVLMVWSLYRFHEVERQVETGKFEQPKFGVPLLTGLIILLGAGSAIWMIAG